MTAHNKISNESTYLFIDEIQPTNINTFVWMRIKNAKKENFTIIHFYDITAPYFNPFRKFTQSKGKSLLFFISFDFLTMTMHV